MAFNSVDDVFYNTTVSGNRLKVFVERLVYTGANSAVGRIHEAITQAGGTGGGITITSANPTRGFAVNSSTSGAPYLGAAVSPAYKYLLGISAWTNISTIVPAEVILTDILHIYPSCSLVTALSPSINNGGGSHPTWTGSNTRMASAKGVQCSIIVTTATTSAPRIEITYADQDGNSQAQTGSMWGPVAATPVGGLLVYANSSAVLGNPYVPLATGDTGMQQINSYNITTSGANSSVASFVLHRPICSIPMSLANTLTERDFLSQGVLPRIYDDACLGIIVQVGGTLPTTVTQLCLELDIGWG